MGEAGLPVWIGVAALISGLLVSAGVSAQAPPARYVGVELGFNRGDFSTAVDSRLYSLKANAGLVAPDYDASITLPVHRYEDEAGFSVAGLGDMSLQAGYILSRATGVTVEGTAYVKLPTADRDDGLGTGEFDCGGLLAVGTRWHTLRVRARAGWIKVGDTASTDYNDVVLYGVSLFEAVGAAGVFAAVDGRSAVSDDLDNPLEVRLGAFRPLEQHYAMNGDVTIGLSDGSATLGANIGIVYWLD